MSFWPASRRIFLYISHAALFLGVHGRVPVHVVELAAERVDHRDRKGRAAHAPAGHAAHRHADIILTQRLLEGDRQVGDVSSVGFSGMVRPAFSKSSLLYMMNEDSP